MSALEFSQNLYFMTSIIPWNYHVSFTPFFSHQGTNNMTANLKGSIDRIICDPPFLSDDCQTKGEFFAVIYKHGNLTLLPQAAVTVRWLSKTWGNPPGQSSTEKQDVNISSSRLIVCTGERMETLVNKLYRPPGVTTTTFEPVHAKGLSNEFYCYANFECDDWKWKKWWFSCHKIIISYTIFTYSARLLLMQTVVYGSVKLFITLSFSFEWSNNVKEHESLRSQYLGFRG